MIVSFSRPDAWTLAESTTTFGRVARPVMSVIAALNRSTVAEMPQTTGMPETAPEPLINRLTMVVFSPAPVAARIPRCASSSTR